MDEYVNKEDVLKIIYDIKQNKEIPKNYGTLLDIIRLVRNIPTADVVEVVRCKDCKHCEFDAEHSGDGYEPEAYCNWYESGVGGLDFCSYGERNDA